MREWLQFVIQAWYTATCHMVGLSIPELSNIKHIHQHLTASFSRPKKSTIDQHRRDGRKRRPEHLRSWFSALQLWKKTWHRIVHTISTLRWHYSMVKLIFQWILICQDRHRLPALSLIVFGSSYPHRRRSSTGLPMRNRGWFREPGPPKTYSITRNEHSAECM